MPMSRVGWEILLAENTAKVGFAINYDRYWTNFSTKSWNTCIADINFNQERTLEHRQR